MARKVFWIALKVFAHFFVANTINTRFFVAKTIYAFFFTKRIYAHFFCRQNDLRVFFVAKTIYALRPESFCALKVAILKVQTFWASGLDVLVEWSTTWFCSFLREIWCKIQYGIVPPLFYLIVAEKSKLRRGLVCCRLRQNSVSPVTVHSQQMFPGWLNSDTDWLQFWHTNCLSLGQGIVYIVAFDLCKKLHVYVY